MIDAAQKREGDGATPTGVYPIRSIWYRDDRIQIPALKLPVHPIQLDDGWCDEPDHPKYNRHVKLPFTASHEDLWREDHRYDVVVVLGHNDDPVIPNFGSCIFFHIAEENYAPTQGCVGVNIDDMMQILPQLNADTKMQISSERMSQ